MTDDEKQADKTHDNRSHLTFEEHDRIPAEIFEAIAALNMNGATKTEVMFRQRQVIEMFLNRFDPETSKTPSWTIYDSLAVDAWKARKLPPKARRGRPTEPIPEFASSQELNKILIRSDYKDLRRAKPTENAEDALSRTAERFGMDVEKVNNIIRLSEKDIGLPAKTSEEPDIVAMWFEWLALRRINFPDK